MKDSSSFKHMKNSSSLTLTIIQTDISWENKEANLQMLERKIHSIVDKAEIIILPEMFSTGFSMNAAELAENMEGPTINWMRRIAASNNIILTGSVIIRENEQFFNRLIWMLPNGQLGYYDKRHLFAFGGEDLYYSSGQKRFIASVKGWKINLQICYDLRFPVWARQSSAALEQNPEFPEYDLLIYVANWPERRNIAWKTLLRARAIENQCYAVGVNRVGNDGNNIYHSGDSMIIDPVGEILYEKHNDEDVYTYTLTAETLTKARSKFPFWKDADKFNIIHQ